MIKIALLDGPLHNNFTIGDVNASPAEIHAQAVRAAILSTNPRAKIVAFPIFKDKLSTSRDVVIEALASAMASDAELLHCSFGFPTVDDKTEKAFADAVARFTCVVASSPARGQAVFPASYSGVLKASGDARLLGEEYSWLNSPHVDFAADPRSPTGFATAGASIGAARFCGIVSAMLIEGKTIEEALDDLRSMASHHGIEQKFS